MDANVPSNWVTQLRKGILELCLLNSLRGGERYGYEIVRGLADVEGLVVQEGTVYPILSRLRREGLLEASLQESDSGPPRKYYALTRHGRQALRAMNRYWKRLTADITGLMEERQ